MQKIIGYKKFSSKSGVNYCILNVQKDWSKSEQKRGAVGQTFDEIWVQDEQTKLISENSIGKEIKTLYEKVGACWQLAEFEIISK